MRLTFVFFAACVACSNDTFTGEDATPPDDSGTDVEAGKGDAAPPFESGSGDVISGDASELRFCLKHTSAIFCDDFDAVGEIHPWTLWTSVTNVLTFVPGRQGQGAQAKPISTVAFLTEQIAQPATISFDMMLPNGAILSSTYVRVTSGSNNLTLGAAALSSQLVFTGSDATQHTFPADSIWHTFKIVLNAGNDAILLEDNTQVAAAPFAQSGSSSNALDIGYVAGTTGGTVDIDNVLIE